MQHLISELSVIGMLMLGKGFFFNERDISFCCTFSMSKAIFTFFLVVQNCQIAASEIYVCSA